MSDNTPIALSLISHTNAGKTTLARTLLSRDVGEVRDAPHVTTEAASFPLIDTAHGDALILWDTPGFGDSARLAQRLRQQGNPVGWFLSQVWDRFRNRAFWLTQKAVRNVRDQADVVLYLVNASEEPGDAGYLAPELAVLEWVGKPVIVLLNQTGPPRAHADERADETRWRDALAEWAHVREVLTFDAFARCWVQEFTLFAAVARVLPESRRPAFDRLVAAWKARRMAQFADAMAALATPVARAACDRVVLPADRLMTRLGKSFGLARSEAESPEGRAASEMSARIGADLRASTDQLIAITGLEGRAASEVLARLESDVRTDAPLDEGKAAVMGGVVTGALSGLAAELAAGGLMMGAGLLAGVVLGALGGAGVARGINVVRGKTEATVRWDDAFLDGLVVSALLRYLAVAHYGRGRGQWRESEYPPFWHVRVAHAVATRQPALAAIWALRATDCEEGLIDDRLREILAKIARGLLDELYPGALGVLAQEPPSRR
jgi:50S ribosome-binding GTPase/Domain of unknown function (DUF3482)